MHINPKVGLKGWLGNGGGIAPFAPIAELEVEVETSTTVVAALHDA